MKKILITTALAAVLIAPNVALARRANVTNWYIEDFKTEIIVNKDSSLTVTENILADCGNVPGKHGIFRILPTIINTTEGKIDTPVTLVSITDARGTAYKYAENYNYEDNTVTWKIGDPDKTISGENFFKIKYIVKNVVRTENSTKFDELYWNLNGNYWDLEIDNFTVDIIFPSEINESNTSIGYYSGYTGDKGMGLATYKWAAPNKLEFAATRPMAPRETITASITFPKNIVMPYRAGLSYYWHWSYLWFFAAAMVFFVCYKSWRKYGIPGKTGKFST